MKKNLAILLASGLAATSVLSACSPSGDTEKSGSGTAAAPSSGAAAAPQYEKRIKISAMVPLWGAAPPDKSSGIKMLEERYNMDYSYVPVAAADYNSKLGVVIASGEIPDLTYIGALNENWYSYLDNGVFLPLEQYINEKDTPNIAKIQEDTMNLMKYKGHIYAIPRNPSQKAAAHVLTIRKDWLDKLGLKMPTTYDELFQVAKQFADNDPDGNGKNDTYGIAVHAGSGGLGGVALMGAFKTPTNIAWSSHTDGKIYPIYAHPNFRLSLEYLVKLYGSGILSKDFVIMKGSQAEDDFLSGKAGIHGDFAWNAFTQERLDKARAVNPSFQWAAIPALTGPEGFQGYAMSAGISGFIAIPASLGKDEAKVKRLLKFLDDQMQPDMNSELYKLWNYGTAGQHYTEAGGKMALSELGNKESPRLYRITGAPGELTGLNNPNDSKDIQDIRNEAYAAALKGTPYRDPTLKLVPTATMKEKGTELNKLLFEDIVKVISGERPLSYYDQALASWKAKGGQQILDEMNQAYKESQGQ
ncbi:MAG: peptide permease [Paenibacillaceae bacterium]|jgi:putative aldouronate transport system substrate-binding protein|nr:peptide permease [Paenibacillaceae bacterium]